jgi:hypothetical protein
VVGVLTVGHQNQKNLQKQLKEPPKEKETVLLVSYDELESMNMLNYCTIILTIMKQDFY